MPVYYLNDIPDLFPDVADTDESGVLAVGGDLSFKRLVAAYENGIFPWFNPGELPLWWAPDPRFVLFPQDLKISKSMRQLLRKGKFEVTYNTHFKEVLRACKMIKRREEEGTWITDDLEKGFLEMHEKGLAISVEVWNQDRELVGGLWGELMGEVFFGESMFAKESNASKYGFVHLVRQLEQVGVKIVDCQVYTEHLESLGAIDLPRDDFMKFIECNSFDAKRNRQIIDVIGGNDLSLNW